MDVNLFLVTLPAYLWSWTMRPWKKIFFCYFMYRMSPNSLQLDSTGSCGRKHPALSHASLSALQFDLQWCNLSVVKTLFQLPACFTEPHDSSWCLPFSADSECTHVEHFACLPSVIFGKTWSAYCLTSSPHHLRIMVILLALVWHEAELNSGKKDQQQNPLCVCQSISEHQEMWLVEMRVVSLSSQCWFARCKFRFYRGWERN